MSQRMAAPTAVLRAVMGSAMPREVLLTGVYTVTFS